MSSPNLPRLKPETFRWHSSPSDPRTVQRLANGTEAWVGIKNQNAKGQYDIYLRLKLVVGHVSSLSLKLLKERFAAALVRLRFEHPEIACSALWGETGPPLIQYTPPRDNTEAINWVWDTIEVRATPQDAFALRSEIVKQRSERKPQSSKPLKIYVVANVPNETTCLAPSSVIEVLMHLNHVYCDGISKRMLAGNLLQRIGQNYERDEEQLLDFKWGDEIANLSEPILDACKVDVEGLGSDFEKAQEEFLDGLGKFGSSWGLNVGLPVGVPRTEWFRFTPAETRTMIQAVKTRVGPQYTISHLGHAATVLALLKAKPLLDDAPKSTTLVMPLAVNGRRYLRDEFVEKQYSSCQTGAIVDFGFLQSWTVDESDLEAVKTMLERGCKHVKQWYDYWVNKEFLLPLGVSKDNLTAAMFDSCVFCLLPVKLQIAPENICKADASYRAPIPSGETSAPVFITDGVVDRYIPGKVMTASGESIFSVSQCDSFLDTYLQDILIRMESWNSATSLSLCYNDGAYKSEDAAAFLDHIAMFMLAITQ